MKTFNITAIVLGLTAFLAGNTTNVNAQNNYSNNYSNNYYNNGDNVSLQTFYDELSPYGVWIQDPQYGYVWRPDVNQNEFRPYYTNGRWVMTEYGNTWVSNYDWGWAPFHYGRWVYNNYREWVWLPDTTWGPAWVDWRSGDGYYGWAPMAPRLSINISFGRRYVTPDLYWNFIPQSNIYINTFPRYNYGRNNVYLRNTTIINNTYVYNNRNYYGGPRMEDIRRATNRNVNIYRLQDGNRPGASRVGNRDITIYRPRPERNEAINRNAAPVRFESRSAGIGRGDNSRNNQSRPNNNGQRDGQMQQRNQQMDQQRGQRDAQMQQRNQQIDQQRGQSDAQMQQRNQQMDQQRGQRDAQMQQRNQQMDQQRAQRDAQMQQRNQQMDQQRAQRDAQMQQRNQQMDQQRAQRDAQMQQRNQQMEQQRGQREAQMQQRNQQMQRNDRQAQPQRSQNTEQSRSNGQQNNNSGRPSRG